MISKFYVLLFIRVLLAAVSESPEEYIEIEDCPSQDFNVSLLQDRVVLARSAQKPKQRISMVVDSSSQEGFHLSSAAWYHAQNPNYLLLQSETRKLLFCAIPKNACTEFMSLVMRLDGMEEADWNPTSAGERQDSVHYNQKRDHLFFESTNHDLLEDVLRRGGKNDWVRAVFLRDPIERLISAYKSKVTTGYAPISASYPTNLTFKEFVDRLEQQGVDDKLDPHIRPQSYICGIDETIDQYDFVGHFDNLDRDAHAMIDMLGFDLAHDILDTGWGPHKNQSLFGVPREVREAGAKMMPVTHASTVSVLDTRASYYSGLGASATYAGEALNSALHSIGRDGSIFFQTTGAELDASFLELKRRVGVDDDLKARIQRLYAKDYDLISQVRRRDPRFQS